MRDDRALLHDILERIQLTYTFTKEGREIFMSSRLIQEAVLRNLEIIGEAARIVSEDLRNLGDICLPLIPVSGSSGVNPALSIFK